MSRKIYLASSWRNLYQESILAALRDAGHEVYDFRNPAPGNTGFAWSAIDPEWLGWEPRAFAEILTSSSVAAEGFRFDKEAIGAIVATVGAGRRGGGAAVGETLVALADVGRRLQLDLAEQEFLAALGPAPTKGAALLGAVREEGGE